MSTQLILQEPRSVLDEPGSGQFLDFRPSSHQAVAKLVKDGVLTTSGVQYCDIAGHFMGRPDPDLASMVAGNWSQTGPWVETQPNFKANGAGVTFLAHKVDSEWELVEHTAPNAGQGRYVSFITYETQASQGGVGTDSPITLTFGGVWKLALHDDGNAVLYERGAGTDVARGQFEWMTAEQFRGTLHQLWIYQVQSKLVIANLARSKNGRQAGFVYRDDGSPEGDDDQLDGDGRRIRHALRSGPWRVGGGGFCTVNVTDQGWLAGEAAVSLKPAALFDQGGSTRKLSAAVHGTSNGPVAASITCVDEDGSTWPDGSGTTSTRHGLGWTVSFTTTEADTFFLGAVDIKIPRLLRTEGGTGTDVLGIPHVADRSIELAREGDLTREHLTAKLTCYQQDLAEYVQPNMAVRYVVDGVTRFRGLTNDAEWRIVADTVVQSGELTLRAEGLFKRFRKAVWPGGRAFDGRLLTECLADLLEAGGLGSSEYELTAWPFRFPATPIGEAPSLVYRPGTTIDGILEDFQRKFYGPTLYHYFRLSDGKFVLQQVPSAGSVAATFYQTSAAAAAAGLPFQTIRDGSFDATLDESDLYNVIVVLGQSPDGRPLMARCVDWASLRDSGVSNYTGEPWPLIVSDPAFQTQAAVNYVCRQLYERHRRPKTFASWVSHRVDLFPGELVYLSGTNYGYTYRLTGVQLRGGGGYSPDGEATYQGERVA